MSYLKPYDPSADYVVVKSFIESGKAYQEGDDYVPRFDSRKRKFRHYVARRIARKELAQPVVEEVVEESIVTEEVAPVVKKTTKRKAKTQAVDSE